MEDFNLIYKILKVLHKAMDDDEFDMDRISFHRLGITQNRWVRLIKMLVDSGYITGVTIMTGADGDISISMSRPEITLKGMEYLEENSLMQKAYRMARGIKDVTPGI